MKRQDLKPCTKCGKGLANGNNIQFFRIQITPMVLNLKSVQQISGLETFFGGGQDGATLANIMGPNPDIAQETGTYEAYMCQNCYLQNYDLIELQEKGEYNDSKRDSTGGA